MRNGRGGSSFEEEDERRGWRETGGGEWKLRWTTQEGLYIKLDQEGKVKVMVILERAG